MAEDLCVRQSFCMGPTVFIRLVHNCFQATVCNRTATQAKRNTLIHHHFVYENVDCARKRHAYVIEDFFGLSLFL